MQVHVAHWAQVWRSWNSRHLFTSLDLSQCAQTLKNSLTCSRDKTIKSTRHRPHCNHAYVLNTHPTEQRCQNCHATHRVHVDHSGRVSSCLPLCSGNTLTEMFLLPPSSFPPSLKRKETKKFSAYPRQSERNQSIPKSPLWQVENPVKAGLKKRSLTMHSEM